MTLDQPEAISLLNWYDSDWNCKHDGVQNSKLTSHFAISPSSSLLVILLLGGHFIEEMESPKTLFLDADDKMELVVAVGKCGHVSPTSRQTSSHYVGIAVTGIAELGVGELVRGGRGGSSCTPLSTDLYRIPTNSRCFTVSRAWRSSSHLWQPLLCLLELGACHPPLPATPCKS